MAKYKITFKKSVAKDLQALPKGDIKQNQWGQTRSICAKIKQGQLDFKNLPNE